MSTIYWCEFPKKVNWEKLASWLDKEIIIYIACKNRKEYENWKTKLNNLSSHFTINAWPTVPFDEGYWISGLSSKKTIDRLDQFKGVPIKIDIEPPKPKTYTFFSSITWLLFSLFKKAKNKEHFENKIKNLSETEDIILSCFPLPNFLIKRWGWIENKKIKYNFMHYSTFLMPGVKFLYNHIYYRWFASNHKNSFFAIGLIGTGIFDNEPVYKNINQMKKDIIFLKSLGIKNFVFFRIGSIVDRGKDWFDLTRST